MTLAANYGMFLMLPQKLTGDGYVFVAHFAISLLGVARVRQDPRLPGRLGWRGLLRIADNCHQLEDPL